MRVAQLRKSAMVWIWQHGKRTDYYKIILNYVIKLMKGPNFKKYEKLGPSVSWYVYE
jgi:hypothetical protein